MHLKPAATAIVTNFPPVECAPPPPRTAKATPRDRLEPGRSNVTPLHAVARKPRDPVALAGLADCIGDAAAAALTPGDGPPDPASYAELKARLEAAAKALPGAMRKAVAEPLLRTVRGLGAAGYESLLNEDPAREGPARLLLDLAQAVLQRGEGYGAKATAAFQEVVEDLYDGFLSAEDRRGVKPPDHGVAAPIVRWGSGATGPYTWPATATARLGVNAALVSLPAANAAGGLLAWPALAHETAGHDILEADVGLRDELSRAVRSGLLADGLPPPVADYWADRIDETAADVLGVLNMGPAAAVGLVGYFRALNGAWGAAPKLRSVGLPEDPHPADLARAYLAAETVRLLSFDGAAKWADRLVAEADRDAAKIRLGDVQVTAGIAKASAVAAARAIVKTRLRALEGHALGEIQDWRNEDEAVVAALRRAVSSEGGGSPGKYTAGAYAAHAVAAGVYEAVSGGATPAKAMSGMVAVLAAMHDPQRGLRAWGPVG